jgi:hypothetical protein
MEDTGRPWSTKVENSLLRPRGKFGMDGRLLLCPVFFPCCAFGLISHGLPQIYWYGGAFAFWVAAQFLWQIAPWFIDDLLAELRVPKWFVDVPHRW